MGPPNFTEMATVTKRRAKAPKGKPATKKPGFYASAPVVPAAKVTSIMPSEQTGSLGNDVPGIVPATQGQSSGFAGVAHSFPKAPAGSHGYGHDAIKRDGAVRLSGHVAAHRIGKRKK